MQEGRWAKIGGFFTVIGTVVAIIAYFSSDKHSSIPGGKYENTYESIGSRSPGQTPSFAAPEKSRASSVDLNGDGFPEAFSKRCFQQPPICEIEVYDAQRNRTLGKLVGDEVSTILPSKTAGYSDIAVLRRRNPAGGASGSSGTVFIYKWNGEYYAQSE